MIERTELGIVVTRIRKDIRQELRDAVENVAASYESFGGGKGPLLVDLREALTLDAETRHYYTSRQLTDYFTAMGIIVPIGAFGATMGNLYLNVAKPAIPSKLFRQESDALAWLARHLPEPKA